MSLSRDNVKAEVFLPGVNARIIKKKTNKQISRCYLSIYVNRNRCKEDIFFFLQRKKMHMIMRINRKKGKVYL